MKQNKKCYKCGANNWERKINEIPSVWQCKKCGYIFDWLDYIEAGHISTSTITVSKSTNPKFVKR